MKSKRSNQEWKSLIDEYKCSPLSIINFSKTKNINPSILGYWFRKFKQSKPKQVNLVKISNSIVSNDKIKIIFKYITLELSAGITSENIAKLVTTIREVC